MSVAAAAHAECKLSQIIEMPVTMLGTRPTVTFYINGQPAKFLIDSGSWASLIDPTAAQAMGLKLAKTDMQVRGVGGDADLYFTTIKSLGFTKDLSFGTSDMLVSAGAGGPGVVGLIGENILGFADIEYDFPHGAVRFFRQEGCVGSNLGYWAENGAAELDLTHTGKLPRSRDRDPNKYDPGDLNRDVRAAAAINGQRVIVTFDTGASLSLLNTPVAARAGVTPNSPGAVPVGLFSGIGPERKSQWVAPFDSFELGSEKISRTRIRFGDLSRVQTDMLLGADFFLSHRIFIANSLSKAFITYVGGPVFNLEDANRQTANAEPSPTAGAAGSAEALVREAAARMGRNDAAGAISSLDRAIAADAKLVDAYVLRGRAKLAAHQPKAAMEDFDQALKLEPQNFDALLARGALLARTGALPAARKDLDLAADQKTADGRARVRVADAYEAAKDYPDAIAQFDAVVATAATDELKVRGYNGRCWNRALMKAELDKALADCNQALRIAPGNPNVLDSRALVHMRRGEIDLALADYDAAVRIQPGVAILLYSRGAARLRKGLEAESEADFAAARKLNPKVGDVAVNLGIVDAAPNAPKVAAAQASPAPVADKSQ